MQLREVINKHKTLEDAHIIQSKFIHKLQKKLSKVDAYIETIEMQERVISKMQTVISSGAPEKNKILKNRNQELNDIERLNDEKKMNFEVENNLRENDNQIRDDLQNRVNDLLEKVTILRI